jgi:hypothetical protein
MRALAQPQALAKQEKFDMSDEVISIEEIVAYSLDTFPGLIEDWNWGERSLFYNPDRQLPKGTYFLSFTEKDGANDSSSRLRPGDYRLSVGISKAAFTNRFGAVPARPTAVGVVQTGHNFGQHDRILPHPIYGWMCWIAILGPTHEIFEETKPLLSEAYGFLHTRHHRARLTVSLREPFMQESEKP